MLIDNACFNPKKQKQNADVINECDQSIHLNIYKRNLSSTHTGFIRHISHILFTVPNKGKELFTNT